MGSLSAATEVLSRIPDLSSSGVGFAVVDATGKTVFSHGEVDGDGRERIEFPIDEGARIVCAMNAAPEGEMRALLEELCRTTVDVARLEGDMESMSTSSLALLEHVAMVDELVSLLPSYDSDEQVVHAALKHLLVAVSARRACYLSWNETTGLCRIQVAVESDKDSGVRTVAPDPRPFDPAISLVGEVLSGGRDDVLESVPERGRLGAPGLPEYLATRQFLAVPVRFGDTRSERTLGVLVVCDKQANSYSTNDRFGSHEAKLAATLGRLIGSAVGSRMVAAVGKELRLAHDIQRQILPAEPAQLAGFDLAGRCVTSSAVGGDYYDFVRMSDGRTLCFVADVSGHNLASGMLMVAARTALRLLAERLEGPAEILTGLADAMIDDLCRTERFISAVGIALRPNESSVEVVNAGHVDVMVRRAGSGRIERLQSADTVLGFMHGVQYHAVEEILEPGDLMLLYTDGVLEAQNESGEMFGERRLEDALRECGTGTAEQVLDAVFEAVDQFADDRRGSDDITALVVRRRRPTEKECWEG